MDFKFAEDLKEGDELMSLGKNLTVASSDQFQEQQGLYSPMTEFGNFYIFAQDVNPEELANSPLMLVHCLSQVNNPLSYEDFVLKSLKVSGFFGLNEHENHFDENYVHTVAKLLSFTGH